MAVESLVFASSCSENADCSSIDAILPAMSSTDFVGILANGKMFRGNANSKGQNHWFETDTYSLDYSLVTSTHQMVKGSFSGSDWNQEEYESYVKRSKEKLSLMERKPIKIKTGDYRTWFESAAVSDFLCLLYTSPSPRDGLLSRMPSSA